MSGSTLAVAPAIEPTAPGGAPAAILPQSHSTPNPLLLRPASFTGRGVQVHSGQTQQFPCTETASLSSTSPAVPQTSPVDPLSFKKLPSLPAFDVPLFDLSLDLETDLDDLFAFRKKKRPASTTDDTSNSSSSPPRRIWEEFIKTPATLAPSTTTRPSTAESPPSSSFASPSGYSARPATAAPAVPAAPVAPAASTNAAAAVLTAPAFTTSSDDRPPSRRRTLANRSRSWMPGLRSSSPDVRALLDLNLGGHDQEIDRDMAVDIPSGERAQHTVEGDDGNSMTGSQQKTTSALLADFARRSLRGRPPSPAKASPSASRSASPSPSSSPTKGRLRDRMARRRPVSVSFSRGWSGMNGDEDRGDSDNDDNRGETKQTMMATSTSAAGTTPLVTLTATAATSSRVFSRAGGYIARIKERPQSLFGRPPAGDDGRGRRRSSSSNSRSSSYSSDGNDSMRDSTHGSTLQPQPSEAESLTTADTSHHTSPLTKPATAGAAVARDPLWTAFRDLETSFYKFLSKTSTAQRMILVRAALVPFLRQHASSSLTMPHLLPDDVERRAAILNRWWTGLLEMLDGPAGLAGSGLFDDSGGGNNNSSSSDSPFFATPTTTNGYFQPVSGIDRPVVLEAASMIMSRPEWRLLTPSFRPRSGAETDELHNHGDGTTAAASTAERTVRGMFVDNLLAQLLLVVHRLAVRQVPLSMVGFGGKACAYAFFFVPGAAELLVRLWALDQNIALLRRTADAMGLPRRRTAVANDKNDNHVAAFFPPALAQLGWTSVTGMHARLRCPPPMHLLGERYAAYERRRQQQQQGSSSAAVPWFAPVWLSRWRGADTDLLFLFCKHYHVLVADFLFPSETDGPTRTLAEKARAPAFVLLHAQLLHVVDSTIHRQAALEAAMVLAGAAPVADCGPSLWMQEQMQRQMQQPTPLSPSQSAMTSIDEEAVNTLLYYPQSNVAREMSEHRLLVLLRDLLTDEAAVEAEEDRARTEAGGYGNGKENDYTLMYARDTFTAVFMGLLKAAALRTSQYDHDACYVLCDLLHETLLVLDSTGVAADAVDWPFWLDVCRKMLASNNTMSEIRVLSFVFGTWDLITADPARKSALCLDWLLAEDVFTRFFAHWCPMVRAFYMRLLCWRLCRDTGRAHALVDADVFVRAAQRLRIVWAHATWLQQQADATGVLPPTTAPSLPQPGRRFMIVRTEMTVPQPGLLARANGLYSGSGSENRLPVLDTLAAAAGNKSKDSKSGDSDSSSSKKKWSLFGKVRNLAAKTPTDEEFEQLRRASAETRAAAIAPSASSFPLTLPALATMSTSSATAVSSARSSSASSESSTGSAPVFEPVQFVFRFVLHNVPLPPQHRQHQPLAALRPRLPAPAQARVHAWTLAAGLRPDSPPPPAAGMPPATRRVSGLAAGGLVSEARNVSSNNSNSSSRSSSLDLHDTPAVDDLPAGVQPLEPRSAVARQQAKYVGCALAEWRLVVSECNSFVERRREEGVYGLKDVEVPSLGVDGLRRAG